MQARSLDPDMTLFKLRQEIHRIPKEQQGPYAVAVKSRQSDLAMPLSALQLGNKQFTDMHPHHQQDMRPKIAIDHNNSYQTITQHGTDAGSQFLAGVHEQPSYL